MDKDKKVIRCSFSDDTGGDQHNNNPHGNGHDNNPLRHSTGSKNKKASLSQKQVEELATKGTTTATTEDGTVVELPLTPELAFALHSNNGGTVHTHANIAGAGQPIVTENGDCFASCFIFVVNSILSAGSDLFSLFSQSREDPQEVNPPIPMGDINNNAGQLNMHLDLGSINNI